MRFDDVHEDENLSGGSDNDSEGEENTSDVHEDAEMAYTGAVNGSVEEAEDEKRTGTKPKKPPTGEELRNIKDATELYRSSSFKLQVSNSLLLLVKNSFAWLCFIRLMLSCLTSSQDMSVMLP